MKQEFSDHQSTPLINTIKGHVSAFVNLISDIEGTHRLLTKLENELAQRSSMRTILAVTDTDTDTDPATTFKTPMEEYADYVDNEIAIYSAPFKTSFMKAFKMFNGIAV